MASGVTNNVYRDDEADEERSHGGTSGNHSGSSSGGQRSALEPSYRTKKNLESVLLLSKKRSDVNEVYNRTRRYDNAG